MEQTRQEISQNVSIGERSVEGDHLRSVWGRCESVMSEGGKGKDGESTGPGEKKGMRTGSQGEETGKLGRGKGS